MVSGCASVGGDLIIRVSGKLPVPSTAQGPGEQCRLEIVSIDSDQRLTGRDVSPEFSTTMMVVAGPRPTPYYFVAACRNGRKFRSSKIIISSRGRYSKNFDLGVFSESAK